MNTSSRRVMRQEIRDNNKLMLTTFALFMIGVIFILSSSSAGLIMNGSKDLTAFMTKQILAGVLATIAGFIVYKMNVKFLVDNYKGIFYFTLVILGIVLLIAPSIKGSRSWLRIGGFSLQPAEFAKITLILTASTVLKNKNVNTAETYKKLCFYTLPILILVVLQGDLGTVMIMGALLLVMMYLGGINKAILGGLTGAGVIAILILSIVSPYRMKRMLIFMNPFEDYYGMGYQIIQSLYSVANGGLLGQGLGNSIHKFGYLPENHTDFIFSIITEEIGFVGAALVVLLFILLITQIFKTAFRVKNKQLSLICAGIGSFIAIESLLNLSVVVSLMPVTGVTLPFISYGGSSLVSKFICIAIVLGINSISKKTEAKYLDEERIKQAKERQHSRKMSMEKANNFRKTAGANIRNLAGAIVNTLVNGYRAAMHAVKENFQKVTSKISSKDNTFANQKTNFSNKKHTLNKDIIHTKLEKKNTLKAKTNSLFKRKTKRKNMFNSQKQSNFNQINLDETYLDQSGFDSKFEENLTEIDLGSIDIKQFNKEKNN